MIEGPEDWATFMDPAVFGEVVSYTPAGLGARDLPAIFTAASAEVAGTSTVSPVLAIGGVLGFTPAPDDVVTVRGVEYRVADDQPDGTGLVRLILERV
ncbi:head-tail joining protein [Paenirhodobacter populi]|uniref:head-tail joining protein n=1 Tax=Paenirhodobacter populi TaxID=2306993 RepID=UPI000FE38C08|nr:hypothetical protein [Sinirhodobacter populi]RWR09710.1 hypothetical protein D2T32_05030 [Sinirhodobacter populi]